jgi:hypothetical protein
VRGRSTRDLSGVVVTFFVPFFNYLLMAALALAPPSATSPG